MRGSLVRDFHVFTGAASTNILRLLPPLCLTEAEAREAVAKIEEAVKKM